MYKVIYLLKQLECFREIVKSAEYIGGDRDLFGSF